LGQLHHATDHAAPGTVYTFAIGGDAKFPDVARYKLGPLISGVRYDPKDARDGGAFYVINCLFCHGVPGVDNGGNIPNLGYVDADLIANLDKTALSKEFVGLGMPDFTGKLNGRGHRKNQGVHQGTADAIRPK
jgi:quinohemoprotein ethanol dehydrogenase